MTRRVAGILGAVLVAAVVVPVLAGPATAAENGLWSVFPTSDRGSNGQVRPYFVLDLRPGQPLRDSVSVVNKTAKPLTFRLYASDGLNLATGAFGLAPPQQQARDLGSWIELSRRTVRVPARSGVAVPFRIDVPPDATPGDHAGGIVPVSTEARAQPARGGNGTSGNVAVLQSVGTRVYARVTGKLAPSLAITRIKVAPTRGVGTWVGASTDATITYTVANNGNVRLAPKATVELSTTLGLYRKDIAAKQLPELLPGNEVTIQERVTGVRSVLRLTATVTVADRATQTTGQQGTLLVPWLVIVILVVTLLVLAERRRRRRRARSAPPEEAEPAPYESLVT